MNADEQAELRAIEDEAIAKCRDRHGRVDHIAAAEHRRSELLDLEAGGHGWAAVVRDAAEMAGHSKAIARRVKATAIAVPAPAGVVSMPNAYSRRGKDGGTQMTLWLHVPLDELQELIGDLLRQSVTLNDRALAMRYGLDLARKHNVDTAAEGFAAEGIDIEEGAA